MKKLAFLLSVITMSSSVFSGNPILDSLKQQGVKVQTLADEDLGKIRGAALIVGQPMPSVTLGFKEHFVTYIGWGSMVDYGSYIYTGGGYNPGAEKYFLYEGNTYRVAGDSWLADLVSSPTSWNRAYAQEVEYHYQILDPNNSYAPSSFAFRETAWNRPISTFSW